jgi:hypothetical protein
MGRLGPAKLKPGPDTTTWEIVAVDLPVLVTATGMIRLMPICTVPKLTFEKENAIWPLATAEIKKIEKRVRIPKDGFRGKPRQLMLFALFCPCSLSTAGEFWSVGSRAGIMSLHATRTALLLFFLAGRSCDRSRKDEAT